MAYMLAAFFAVVWNVVSSFAQRAEASEFLI